MNRPAHRLAPTAPRPALLAGALVSAVVAMAACEGSHVTAVRGRERYTQCEPCHGAAGAGMPLIEAPAIAGLPSWYVEAQLTKFRIGARGTHFDDVSGMKMRPMALTMPTEEDVKAVAEYVSSLPVIASHPTTLEGGDKTKGATAFATCAACHGTDGGGNKALGAPPIAGDADWYIFAQLKKFKGGLRGAHKDDATGATMRAIAVTIPDEQAMKDLAAHVSNMTRPASVGP